MSAVRPGVAERVVPKKGLFIAGRDVSGCVPLTEVLAALGMNQPKLVSQVGRPEEIISRADTEGGTPILVGWSACEDPVHLVAEMLSIDTLPGRPYVIFAPSDLLAAMGSERVEAMVPHAHERVLVINLADIDSAVLQDLLRLHLSRACASYLGRTRKLRAARPSPLTDLPLAERNINGIDRRVMQRGMFRVAALRVPRF